MPNDSKGVKMIYPNSKTNPQSIYYNGSLTDKIQMRQDLDDDKHGSNGVLSFLTGNGNGHLDFLTSSGYNSAKVRPPDHSRYQTQGYMQDDKDWKNVECTVYIKLNETSTSNFFHWQTRMGLDRRQAGDCEACGYGGQIVPDGRVRPVKTYYSYHTFWRDYMPATDDIEDRWIGFKFIVYNKGNSVVTEIWVDEDNTNNWVRKRNSNDDGNWGTGGDHCSADEDNEKLLWGGPICSLIWVSADEPESVYFQKISVREIDGSAAFEDDDDDSGGDGDGDGDGGDGDGDGDGGTGGTGGMADKFGVVSRYGSGEIRYDHEEDFRGDSYRWDFHDWSAENYELRGYFSASGDVNDEVSGVLGGGRHSSGSSPRSYSVGIDTDTGGDPRYRFEEDHPDYEDGQEGPGDGDGGGIGLQSGFVGFAFVIRNLDDGVLLEIHQDQGDNEGDEPANEWKRVASWVDTEFNQQERPSDAMTLLRIDGNVDNLDYKWIAVQEILDGDSETPGTGGGPGNGGGGGGTCCDDDPIPNPDDDDDDDGGGSGSGGTGDGTGNTGSGPSTPPAPSAPPREVYQTAYLELMWNINYISGDPCNVNAPPEGIEPQEVFTNPGDDSYVNLPRDLLTGGWFVNKSSVLIGRKIRKMNVIMKKFGTPTGLIKIRIYDKTNTVVDEFDTEINASVLDGNDTTYEFFRDIPTRKLEEKDRISVDFFGTGIVADSINYIRVKISESDKVDSTATCLFVSDDNQNIEVNETIDLAGSVYI